jgi:hypothetical protein
MLLKTLSKNVVGDGYAILEMQEEMDAQFFNNSDITTEDKVTGYIYILSSLSDNPVVKKEKNLYKIGFTTNSVEQRIANAENDPTYLMAPVKIVATYKVVNMNSQMFEDLVHQLLMPVQFQVTVFDEQGKEHQPQEWFVVPLPVVMLSSRRSWMEQSLALPTILSWSAWKNEWSKINPPLTRLV